MAKSDHFNCKTSIAFIEFLGLMKRIFEEKSNNKNGWKIFQVRQLDLKVQWYKIEI